MLKIKYFLKNLQTSRINNSRICRIRNAKFTGYYKSSSAAGRTENDLPIPSLIFGMPISRNT